MSALDMTRSYGDGQILLAADFDVFLDDLEELINTTGLNDDNLQPAGITASLKFVASSISSNKFAAGSVTNAKIASNVIVESDIADSAITTDKIASTTLDVAKFASGSITSTGLASNSVITAGVANAVITPEKFATATTVGTGATFSTSSITWSTVVSVTMSLTGNRPVLVQCESTSNTAGSAYNGTSEVALGGRNSAANFRIIESSRVLWASQLSIFGPDVSASERATLYIPNASMYTLDTSPPSGSVTYSFQAAASNDGVYNALASNVKLRAYEL